MASKECENKICTYKLSWDGDDFPLPAGLMLARGFSQLDEIVIKWYLVILSLSLRVFLLEFIFKPYYSGRLIAECYIIVYTSYIM